MKYLRYLWSRRTTVQGYVVVILGSLATSQGLFSARTLAWIVLINGMLQASVGHYNQRQINRAAK